MKLLGPAFLAIMALLASAPTADAAKQEDKLFFEDEQYWGRFAQENADSFALPTSRPTAAPSKSPVASPTAPVVPPAGPPTLAPTPRPTTAAPTPSPTTSVTCAVDVSTMKSVDVFTVWGPAGARLTDSILFLLLSL